MLEGAGSPGEVNLKHHDIVNMRMAQHAGAAVLVVGDIDRGGVFASFVGTLEVLDPWERRLVAGWIVNRFRGDAGLLDPALEYTLRPHRPARSWASFPIWPSLGLPQEDSVEFKSGLLDSPGGNGEAVEIAVDRSAPHLELHRLRRLPRRKRRAAADRPPRHPTCGQPDAVVLPGSKNTLADLDYLRRNGLAERIEQLARGDKSEVVGICGGFQMLGREIRDPAGPGVGQWSRRRGLDCWTPSPFWPPKRRSSAPRRRTSPSGLEVGGYEIHHGRTSGNGSPPLFVGRGRPLARGRQRRRPRLGHVSPRRFRRRRASAAGSSTACGAAAGSLRWAE